MSVSPATRGHKPATKDWIIFSLSSVKRSTIEYSWCTSWSSTENAKGVVCLAKLPDWSVTWKLCCQTRSVGFQNPIGYWCWSGFQAKVSDKFFSVQQTFVLFAEGSRHCKTTVKLLLWRNMAHPVVQQRCSRLPIGQLLCHRIWIHTAIQVHDTSALPQHECIAAYHRQNQALRVQSQQASQRPLVIARHWLA